MKSNFYDKVSLEEMLEELTRQAQRSHFSSIDEKRLKALEQEFAQKTKQLRLNYFKSLARPVRQAMIDSLFGAQHFKQMNDIVETPSEELKELRNAKNIHRDFLGGSFNIPNHSRSWVDLLTRLLPEGITAEELLTAHMDISMEEELGEQEKE